MVIRRNTKKFKEIESVVKKFQNDKNRTRRVRLFSLKAGQDVSERIEIEKNNVLYNFTYQTLIDYFQSRYILHEDDDNEELYYFVAENKILLLPFELNMKLMKV